jgi:hypothetical protein
MKNAPQRSASAHQRRGSAISRIGVSSMFLLFLEFHSASSCRA